MVLLNYRSQESGETLADGIHWHALDLLPDPTRYYRYVIDLARQAPTDWLLGFSDTWFGICAESVARRVRTRAVIDAYDNYESYMPWCPPLHWLYRRALRRCTAIVAAGPGLLALMGRGRNDLDRIGLVVPMAADPEFTPGERGPARGRLSLPLDVECVIYSGSLFHNRGITVLLDACQQLLKSRPQLQFIFSGRKAADLCLPANCRYMGYLDDAQLKDLYRSADLLVAVNLENAFGKYSYPVKIYEALAMGVPVVASRTSSTAYVLQDYPGALVVPNDVDALVERISQVLDAPYPVNRSQAGWSSQVRQLESLLQSQ